MMGITAWLDRKFYPAYHDGWDDTLFRSAVLERLHPEAVVLDLGAGAGIIPQMDFRGHAKQVVGIDLDERVLENPHLHSAHVGSADSLPFPDSFFDVVLSDNVFEHLHDPAAVMREIQRVLKPAGVLLIKTPNTRHYVTTIARLTPSRFHKFMKKETFGRGHEDTFPTVYRANSVRSLRALASETGLKVLGIQLVEGRPEYLRFFWGAYLFGLLYERLVNSTETLRSCRVLLIAAFQRTA